MSKISIEIPDFIIVNRALRAHASLVSPGSDKYESKKRPYHQQEVGILYPPIGEHYKRAGEIRYFPFDTITDNICWLPQLTESDITVILSDPKEARACEGFYTIILQKREFVKLKGNTLEQIAEDAKRFGAKFWGYEDVLSELKNLLTFNLRFSQRLEDIPIEFARRMHIPKERLKELNEGLQP